MTIKVSITKRLHKPRLWNINILHPVHFHVDSTVYELDLIESGLFPVKSVIWSKWCYVEGHAAANVFIIAMLANSM